jgi:hypothetical protein
MLVDRRHAHGSVVGDQDVQAAESGEDPTDEAACRGRLGKVGGERPFPVRRRGDGPTIGPEDGNERPPEAAAGTGDESDARRRDGLALHAAPGHWMTTPPLGEYSAPVVHGASAMWRIAAAISSGRPIRPSGTVEV